MPECPFCKTQVVGDRALYWHVKAYHNHAKMVKDNRNTIIYSFDTACPICSKRVSKSTFSDHLGNDRTPLEHLIRMELMQ